MAIKPGIPPVILSQKEASDLLLSVARAQDDYAAGEAMKVNRTALLLLEQLGLVRVENPEAKG